MEKEEILKTRFVLTDNFPACRNTIGDIFLADADGYININLQVNREVYSINANYFPHLFKPLKWYENRTESEMPKFIEFNKIVTRVGSWDLGNEQGWICCNIGGGCFHQDAIIPASEEDYINQQTINPKQK